MSAVKKEIIGSVDQARESKFVKDSLADLKERLNSMRLGRIQEKGQ